MHGETHVGRVVSYAPWAHTAIVRVDSGGLHVGDYIHVHSRGRDVVERVLSIRRGGRDIDEARAGQDVSIPLDPWVDEAADVRRLTDPYDARMGRVLADLFGGR